MCRIGKEKEKLAIYIDTWAKLVVKMNQGIDVAEMNDPGQQKIFKSS